MRLRTILGIIAALIISPPLLLIGGLAVREHTLRAKGYHIGITGWQLAKEIAEKHLTVTECSKIDNFPELMAPTSGEQRSLCYFEVAKLLKDPQVCEYLMPSDYGLACLGGAINLDGLFRNLEKPIYTKVGVPGMDGSLLVKLDSPLQEWVNTDEKIVVDIATISGSGVIGFYAWENVSNIEQMSKVVWMERQFVNDDGNTVNQKVWVKQSDNELRWSAKLRKFVPLIPQ